MTTASPYRTLGVKSKASDDEIRTAYRKLAQKHHPDVSSDPKATERFTEITTAYEILSDPEKRAAFDAGPTAPPAAEPTPPPQSPPSTATATPQAPQAPQPSAPTEPTGEEESHEIGFDFLDDLRACILAFSQTPMAIDTCKAFLLAADADEPARSASLDAIVHLYMRHDDAAAITATALDNASTMASDEVTAAIISGAAADLVEDGTLDSGIDVRALANQYLQKAMAATGTGAIPPTAY